MTSSERDPLDRLVNAGFLEETAFREHPLGADDDSDPADAYDRQLAQLAVRQHLITPQQYVECLQEQRRDAAAGRPRPTIQQLLRRRGLIGDVGIDRLSRELTDGKMRVVGKYAVLEKVGEGGLAQVYRGYDQELRRTVALKFVRGASEADIERMRLEAQITAQLHHSCIAQVYDFLVDGGEPCIVMQFIAGPTLDKANLPRRTMLEVMARVCEAVDYAHTQKVVHRDLKPMNIMVDLEGTGAPRPFVMDFGLAKTIDVDRKLSVTGSVMGTPYYMPPEQAAGRRDEVDARSDTYALGATLFHLVTGRPVFEGNDFADVIFKTLQAEPPLPRKIDSTISRDLEAILLKALSKDKAQRYQTAAQLGDDLQHLLRAEPVMATRLGWSTLILRKIRRSRSLLTGAAATLVLGIVAAAWLASGARAGQIHEASRLAATRASSRGEELLRQALEMLDEPVFTRERYLARLADAGAALDEALKIEPDGAMHRINRGRVHEAAAEIAAAEEAYRRATVLDPKLAAGWLRLGLLGAGRRTELLGHLGAFTELGLHMTRRPMFNRETSEPFLAALRQAAELSGGANDADLLYGRALTALIEDRLDEAGTLCAQAVSQFPRNERLLTLQGRICNAKGDLEEAGRLFQLAIESRRWHPEAHAELGHLLLLQGRLDDAAIHGRDILAVEPANANGIMLLLSIHVLRGETAAAMEYALKLQKDPNSGWMGYYHSGMMKAQSGDPRGLEDMDRAAELAPRAMMVYYNRSTMKSMYFGDIAGAIQDAETVIKLEPGLPHGHVLRGQALYEGARLEESLKAFDRAREIQPDHPLILAFRARALIGLGRLAEAERDLARALEIDPANRKAQYQTGILKLQRDDPAGALGHLTLAVEGEPETHAFRTGRAAAYMLLGRWEESRRDYEAALRINPRDLEPEAGLAQVSYRESFAIRQADPQKALRLLREAAERLDGTIAAAPPARVLGLAHLTRAWVVGDLGRVDQAIADAEAAVRISPGLEAEAKPFLEHFRSLIPPERDH